MFSLHRVKHKNRENEELMRKLRLRTKSKSPVHEGTNLSEYSKERLASFNRSLSVEKRTRNPQAVLKKGVIPLIHPDGHSFRTKSEKGNIYVKKYQKQAEKIANSIEEFKKSHLEPEQFQDRKNWLREYNNSVNFSPNKKSVFLASLRVQKSCLSSGGLTLEPLNGARIANPSFRDEDKAKWTGNKDFTKFFKILNEKLGAEGADSEPYGQSSGVFEQNLRRRNKSKEIDKFRSTFAKDTWNSLIPRPISNATFFSEERAKSLFRNTKVYVKSLGQVSD